MACEAAEPEAAPCELVEDFAVLTAPNADPSVLAYWPERPPGAPADPSLDLLLWMLLAAKPAVAPPLPDMVPPASAGPASAELERVFEEVGSCGRVLTDFRAVLAEEPLLLGKLTGSWIVLMARESTDWRDLTISSESVGGAGMLTRSGISLGSALMSPGPGSAWPPEPRLLGSLAAILMVVGVFECSFRPSADMITGQRQCFEVMVMTMVRRRKYESRWKQH